MKAILEQIERRRAESPTDEQSATIGGPLGVDTGTRSPQVATIATDAAR